MTKIINLSHTRGDTWKRTLTFRDSANALINLTGGSIIMTVKRDPESVEYVSQASATLLDQTTNTGQATITLAGTDFNIENGLLWYDIQWTDSAGTIVTFMKGNFEIMYDVT